MPDLFIIDENWQEQSWFSTGGTRAKKYLESPDHKYYYFKRSHYKLPSNNNTAKDYRYEFWSEIIAYEVRKMLGFDVLKYDLAIDSEIVGCISESMINSEREELIEGIKYLQAFDNSFNPERNELRSNYTFELIDSAFNKFKLGEFKEQLIKMFVFDAIIGNGDRHQENWAIISEFTPLTLGMSEIQHGFPLLGRIDKTWVKKFINWTSKQFKKPADLDRLNKIKLEFKTKKRFAPIYDNGSSLGRELANEKVNELLADEKKIKNYISRGLSEIHWNKKKLSHFNFLGEIKNSAFQEIIGTIIGNILLLYDENKIERLVSEVDKKLPDSYSTYKIPHERKQLIFKLITLRIEKLRELQ